MSAQGLAGPVTAQGAALASALNLDKGVNTYFQGSKDEECYGRVQLQPLCFVDDLLIGAQKCKRPEGWLSKILICYKREAT